MSIKTSSAKAKGRKFQQQIAQQVSDLLEIPWGKDEAISSRIMGDSGVDIALIGEARKLFPWSVECKSDKSFQLKSWIRQASANILPNTNWIVFFKKNNFKPVAVFDACLFDELYKEVNLKLSLYQHNKSTWFLEKWIKAMMEKHQESWALYLPLTTEKRITLMSMDQFFEMMKNYPHSIKGKHQTY